MVQTTATAMAAVAAHRTAGRGGKMALARRAASDSPIQGSVYAIETPRQVLPGVGRRRQAGPQHVLAVAHAIARPCFAALRARPGNASRLPGACGSAAPGAPAVRRRDSAAVAPLPDAAFPGYSYRTFFNRSMARRRNSPTVEALMPSADPISGYRKPSMRRNRHRRCCSERPSTAL
jgi:hypothetical protein